MRISIRAFACVFGLAIPFAAFATVAAAEDGGPIRVCTSPTTGPSCTILRPLPAPPRIAPSDAPDCIVAVGGLGSDNDDDTFETLLAGFKNDPRYAIHRFGSSGEHPERFPYDTYGSIDRSGRALRDYVRWLSAGCRAIHIVAHSMGGDVADRAFSLGLSSADGVVTYLPIATPHNGALLAEILTEADDVSDEGNAFLREASQTLRSLGIGFAHDLTSDAVRELADRPLPRPPRGVLEMRQRLANDEIALLPDNADWRFESRDRLPDLHGLDALAVDLAGAAAGPSTVVTRAARIVGDAATVTGNAVQHGLGVIKELEGHGGSLVNDQIRRTTEFVIRNLALPPDDRDLKEKVLAFALSVGVMVLMVVVASKLSAKLLAGVLIGTWVTVPLRAVLPGWDKWWERSFPNLLVKTTLEVGKDELVSASQRRALPYVKGVVTRLSHEVDRLADADADIDVNGVDHVHRADPRVAFVRGVLGRAAQLLSHL